MNQKKLVNLYLYIKENIIKRGFGYEIDWQEDKRIEDLDEKSLLREFAWVVLSSGMRETVIRNKFPLISQAFCNWDIIQIVTNKDKCRSEALYVFGNIKKINAILLLIEKIYEEGFNSFKSKIIDCGIEFIEMLPFMGPATSYHLAKNLGLDVVKPDRHLVRVAKKTGYSCPEELCNTISDYVGDKKSVVDVVIWRFAAIQPDYLDYFVCN